MLISSLNFSTSPATSNIKRDSATISWSTSDSVTSILRYGISENYTDSVILNTADTAFSVNLSGLLAETEYHYQVKIRKADGSDSTTSADATFTTLDAFKFSTSPAINNLTDSSITYSFITNSTASGRIIYGESPSFTDTLNLLSGTNVDELITGLSESTDYTIKSEMIEDGTGDLLNSDTLNFTTAASFRFLNDPIVTTIKRDSVELYFSSSDSATATVFWGLTNSYTDSITINNVDTSFSVWLTGLTEQTSYISQTRINQSNGAGIILSNELNFATADSFAFSLDPNIINLTDTSASVSLETNTNSSAKLYFGTTKTFTDTIESLSFDTSHQIDIVTFKSKNVVFLSS